MTMLFVLVMNCEFVSSGCGACLAMLLSYHGLMTNVACSCVMNYYVLF